MAISHLCLSCGYDLARVRVRPDPHYGLPVVRCPDCGEAAVRRRHPLQQGWRTLLRVAISLTALLVQLAMLSGFATAVIAVCILAAERWIGGGPLITYRLELVVAILVFGALPVALGTWLTAGLAHVRRLPAWLLFSSCILILMSVDCVGEPLARRGLEALGLSVTSIDFRWDRFLVRLVLLIVIMTTALAGIPFGMAARAGHRHWRQTRWRMRRRRCKLRRTTR